MRREVDRPIGASITPRGELERAPGQRDVAALHRPRRNLPDEALVPARGTRRDEQPARVPVEPVHDPRAHLVADRGDLGEPGEQAVHERPVGVARAGMHDQARGLGDHDHVVVGVPHVDLDRGVTGRSRTDRRPVEELDDRAADQTVALPHRMAVDHDRVAREQRLHVGATPTSEERDRAVDTLPLERRGYRNGVTHRTTGAAAHAASTG